MKLSLGTVQLGVPYGINNAKGKMTDAEAYELLRAAHDNGFTMLDTSSEYGLAEERIGAYERKHPNQFEICAKFNASYSKEKLDFLRKRSLERMGRVDHYVYYCVDFDVSKLEAGISDGVSVYSVEEAEAIADNFHLVQVPASILDGRMDAEIKKLQSKGKRVLIRSLLLQGLLATDTSIQPTGNIGNGEMIQAAEEYIEKLRRLANDYGMSKVEMCIRWAWEISPGVAIVGCETTEQVEQVGQYFNKGPLPYSMISSVRKIREEVPEIVISPRLWGQVYDFTSAAT